MNPGISHPHLAPGDTVVVAMSGGVDSSLSAALLHEQGYRVIGLFMKNWEEMIDGLCSTARDFEDVLAVASLIGIPAYSVNFTQEYRDQVFSHFLSTLQEGKTPNPDILCNRHIKFKLLLEQARALGATMLATGHYAQSIFGSGAFQLAKGVDTTKDQSYFLYTLDQEALAACLFPIGAMTKAEVRKQAKALGLPVAEKKDSTGICFIGERNFNQFLSQYLLHQHGAIRMLEGGHKVGTHRGIAYHTIGQRKGLNIGGKGEAYFVAAKDTPNNIVYVVQGAMHPALFADSLTASETTWVSGKAPSPLPFACQAKIRYRQPDQPCVITSFAQGHVEVVFSTPQRAITPGQSIVFYQGSCCLGGAIIETGGPSYYTQGKALPLTI